MTEQKYFGTDGIRGKVGDNPITPEFILKLGWATGKVLAINGSSKIIIGRDTRISGYMLESVLAAGLTAAGISTMLTGPIPTPAIAYLTKNLRAEAGIVISASHNPFYDNGIKFFSVQGTKITDNLEKAIEDKLSEKLICVELAKLGRASRIDDAAKRYIRFCKDTFSESISLKGLKIIVDCANGATYQIAPNILRELGAQVLAIGCQPDGININKECGTTDIRQLQHKVLTENANIGIAYDGDGDRMIMVDHLGYKVDGDQIVYIIARDKMQQGKLIGGVVGTFMSNMGLELSFQQLGIPFVRTSVGDRYVLNKMQKTGWRIGAENSGHVILLDYNTTGDGIIAGLQVLSAMVNNSMTLHNLCRNIQLFPQKLINIGLISHQNPLISTTVINACKVAKQELAKHGRILIRKSGTENIIRVMVEGEDEAKVTYLAHYLANAVKTSS